MNNPMGPNIAARFSIDVHALICHEAEKSGLTKTEVVRNATIKQLKQPSLELLLKKLELRMLTHCFEMNCIVVGLTKVQRQEAVAECNAKFGKRILL
jgi:hypothetical protein